MQLSKDTNAFWGKRVSNGQRMHNINLSFNMNNFFRVSTGPPLRALSDGTFDIDKASTAQDDARAYNMIVSATVEVSDVHFANGVLQGTLSPSERPTTHSSHTQLTHFGTTTIIRQYRFSDQICSGY
jgi:hypothetical protein